jgi:hypothetical protein
MRIRLFAFLAAVLLPLPCVADTVTYTYTGDTFTYVVGPYTTSDFFTAQITLSAPLADNLPYFTSVTPISFSFSDGVQTITEATASLPNSVFFFATDGTGTISYWNIRVSDPSVIDELGTYNESNGLHLDYGYLDGGVSIGVSSTLGTWTSTSDIAVAPEPSSLMLVATGIVGVAASIRRRFTHA